MAKLVMKKSPSFERDVMTKAAEMVTAGQTKEDLGIEAFGSVKVYIDIEPKKLLQAFDGNATTHPELKDKKVYVGSDE